MIFPDSDAAERRHFSILHKVVLDICPLELSTILSNMSYGEINASDVDGRTALWWATSRGANDAVSLLLHYGADPNILPWPESSSPLQEATNSGNHVITKLLFEAGTKMENPPFDGYTALHGIAFRHDSRKIAKLLHRYGADINAQAKWGETALMLALAMGNTGVAAYLIEQKARVNQLQNEGANALFYAVRGQNLQGVRLLFHHNVDHNARSSVFGTVLHFAARYASLEMLEVLYEARLVWKNTSDRHEGLTPLQIAQQRTNVPTEWLPTFMKILSMALFDYQMPTNSLRTAELGSEDDEDCEPFTECAEFQL